MARREFTSAQSFDQRVTAERKATTADPVTGFVTEAWVALGTFWVSIDSQKLSERLKEPIVADTLQSPYDFIVSMRAETFVRLGIIVADRLVWKGEYLDVKDILEGQLRSRITKLAVRRGMNDG